MKKLIIGVLATTILVPLALFAGVGDTEAASTASSTDPSTDVLIAASGSTAEVAQEIINYPIDPALAVPDQQLSVSPELQTFIDLVSTGQADVLTGVFVNEDFSLPVVQQPDNKPGYISSAKNAVTDFRLARKHGSIGLIAHNYLAGKQFDQFSVGQTVYLVYGDSQVMAYTIAKVDRYQALSPNSPYSDFVNLDGTEGKISAEDLFYRMYGQEDAVVFQTCIEKDGDLSWGRLFVTAVPQFYFPTVSVSVDPH